MNGEIYTSIGLKNMQFVELEECLASQNRSRDEVKILRIDELAQLGCCCFCSTLYIGNDAFISANKQKVCAFFRACKCATDFVHASLGKARDEFCAYKPVMNTPTNRKV